MNFQEDVITKIQDAIREDKLSQISALLLELKFIEEQYGQRIISDQEMIRDSSEKLFGIVTILEDLKQISPNQNPQEQEVLPLLLDLDYRLNQLMTEINGYVERFDHLISLLPPPENPPT